MRLFFSLRVVRRQIKRIKISFEKKKSEQKMKVINCIIQTCGNKGGNIPQINFLKDTLIMNFIIHMSDKLFTIMFNKYDKGYFFYIRV